MVDEIYDPLHCLAGLDNGHKRPQAAEIHVRLALWHLPEHGK